MEIKDNHEALVQMLLLALKAPTDEQAQRATELAESFIIDAGLTEIDVARAKREVDEWWKEENA